MPEVKIKAKEIRVLNINAEQPDIFISAFDLIIWLHQFKGDIKGIADEGELVLVDSIREAIEDLI